MDPTASFVAQIFLWDLQLFCSLCCLTQGLIYQRDSLMFQYA
jgi:hypothetical protein